MGRRDLEKLNERFIEFNFYLDSIHPANLPS